MTYERNPTPGRRRQTAGQVINFGCRLNAMEGDAIAELTAGNASHRVFTIVNTCSVTAEAVRQARQKIRQLHRQRPGQPIIVTGCAASTDAAVLRTLPGVVNVVPNTEKFDLKRYGIRSLPNKACSSSPVRAAGKNANHHPFAPFATQPHRTRALLQIQNGCDHACTFCVIPRCRGASHSLAPATLIATAERLISRGHPEIVLTGIDLCSYRFTRDGQTINLGRLVDEMLRSLPNLKRLRLSSLDPAAVDENLMDAFARHSRLMPHVHLSLQSGADLILKRMRRRHRAADLLALGIRLRKARPDITIAADVIAGFPTETAEHHQQTCATIESLALNQLHVFPYSARAGTPAARMPAVPPHEIQHRAASLRKLARRLHDDTLARHHGKTVPVLFETEFLGKTPQNLPVRSIDRREIGAIVSVSTAHRGHPYLETRIQPDATGEW